MKIAAGDYHSAAIKADGTLWAWGYNGESQLGNASVINESSPVQIGSDTNWDLVEAAYHVLAIKK